MHQRKQSRQGSQGARSDAFGIPSGHLLDTGGGYAHWNIKCGGGDL